MLLPVRRFDWLLPPSNCEPHKRTPPRQVCFDGHVRFAGRRASHWAGACGWDRGSSLSVSTRSPSLYHSTVGVGRPSALQFRVAGSPLETIRSEGCSTIRGGESSCRRRDPGKTEKEKDLSGPTLHLCNKPISISLSKGCPILFLLGQSHIEFSSI